MGGGIGVASLVGDATSDPPLTAPGRGNPAGLTGPSVWFLRGLGGDGVFVPPKHLPSLPAGLYYLLVGFTDYFSYPAPPIAFLLWEGHQASGSQRTGL